MQNSNYVKVMKKLFSLIVVIYSQYRHIPNIMLYPLNIRNFVYLRYLKKLFKNLIYGFKIFRHMVWGLPFAFLTGPGKCEVDLFLKSKAMSYFPAHPQPSINAKHKLCTR